MNNSFNPARMKLSLWLSIVGVGLVFGSFLIGVKTSQVRNQTVKVSEPPPTVTTSSAQESFGGYGITPDVGPQPSREEDPNSTLVIKRFYVSIGDPKLSQDEQSVLADEVKRKANSLVVKSSKGRTYFLRLVPTYDEVQGLKEVQKLQRLGFAARLIPQDSYAR